MLYFRDILVFYKNEKISGITKICFGCNESVLIGTKYNADTFGQCGVYSKLKSFLAKAI